MLNTECEIDRRDMAFITNIPRYIVGAAGVATSLYFLFDEPSNPVTIIASLFFLVICTADTLWTKIPNIACLSLALAGFSYHVIYSSPHGLLSAFLGGIAGLGLLLIPYLMGGMGAGDVKALGALGVLLGPVAVFQVFLYTCLVGGILSLIHYAVSGNMTNRFRYCWGAFLVFMGSKKMKDLLPHSYREKLRFPYAAAIAFGFYFFETWGEFF